jgi:hypothetical protein
VSLWLFIPLLLAAGIASIVGPGIFGHRWYLMLTLVWVLFLIVDTVFLGSLTDRALDLGFGALMFWMYWRGRPPKDRGKLRRAAGARMQAIIDRMAEVTRPAVRGKV